jgi:hypothetical protein
MVHAMNLLDTDQPTPGPLLTHEEDAPEGAFAKQLHSGKMTMARCIKRVMKGQREEPASTRLPGVALHASVE